MNTYLYHVLFPGKTETNMLETSAPLDRGHYVTNILGGPFQVMWVAHYQSASSCTQTVLKLVKSNIALPKLPF